MLLMRPEWPRPAASAAIFRDGQVLIAERGKGALRGTWSLPGGHIEPGETAMAAALQEEGIAVVGSRIVPRWSGREPLIARARVVRDQFSLLELGPDRFPYPRAVGAGFGVNRARTGALRFDPRLGRREGKLFSGEESEFCHRVTEAGLGIVYQGGAVVEHVIAPERMRLGWVLKRLL